MNDNIVIPNDPFDKFWRIYRTLYNTSCFFDKTSALRFSAIAAVTTKGEPIDIANKIKKTADEIKESEGWFGDLNSSIRFIIAAILEQNNDSFQSFSDEIQRVKPKFDQYDIRKSGIYNIMTILILRMNACFCPIQDDQLIKVKEIYEQMKKYHWWLTGPEDLPACAVLSARNETPEHIGDHIEKIYEALCKKGFSPGDNLQNAANMLFLSDIDPKHIARRFYMLSEGFINKGTAIWRSDYEELAILSFLDEAHNDVVDTILKIREKIYDASLCSDPSISFNLAASLAFIELTAHNGTYKRLADSKMLVDMQNIINAQQAAMCAACGAAAAAN